MEPGTSRDLIERISKLEVEQRRLGVRGEDQRVEAIGREVADLQGELAEAVRRELGTSA
jgi:hypothetical protein